VVTNIAAYQFAPLTDLKALRTELLERCRAAGLRGTILLSTEGINLFVAGEAAAVEDLLARLRQVPGLEALTAKVSASQTQPFTRLVVRIKREIIAFGVPDIDPARHPSPKLAPRELKRWLDEGRPVVLLDTRNAYEVRLGTFRGAKDLQIGHFRQFPAAVRELPGELKTTPIVMFCTGGIRCEKAGPFMQREGFQSVFQLDGGILKYFEECGNAHYDGECFVFDQRVGVDPALRETDTALCFVCQAALTPADQADPRYVPGRSCPACHARPAERAERQRRSREAEFAALGHNLPGSQAYENRRPLKVPASCDGSGLADFLTTILPQIPAAEWRKKIASGHLRRADGTVLGPDDVVRAGERIAHIEPGTVEPPVRTDVRILHEDEAILVLDKPAPLPMHPCGRFHRNTLQVFLAQIYAPMKPRPAHRLDANTSGLVVCARTQRFARMLQPQFAAGLVRKTYLVEVDGNPADDAFVCDDPISEEPGALGTRTISATGLAARTEFRVLRRRGGRTLLEAVPVTGRTNQIRLHLWQRGWPVVGDPAYRADRTLGTSQTLLPSDPPMHLHAWKIALRHPLTNHPVEFSTVPPAWHD
jgi:UPF0176 protein